MGNRVKKLRQKLGENELDAIIISQADNRRYLSRFTGSAGLLIISQEDAILATDFRYVEQAEEQAPEFRIIPIKGEGIKWLSSELLSELDGKTIGFEANDLSFTAYQQLNKTFSQIQPKGRKKLVPTEGLVESLRAVKEEEELVHIEKAAAIADAAFEHVASKLEPGITEKQVAWELEKFLRQNGSEVVPFDLIVASGPRSALPHARPSERAIRSGEPVVIDIGARVEGYCSDLSRTICLGESDPTLEKIYDVVLGAQLTAMATISPGMTGGQADRLARTVIEQAGYSDAFGHGLGHGIGLAPHEIPRLGPNSATVLTEGMVFTIEPGIYLKGWGGVRIEDMVVLEKGKVRALTKAKKTD